MQTITATLARSIFASPDGFAVMLGLDELNMEVKLVGSLGELEIGRQWEFTGGWKNGRHGRQFDVESAAPCLPRGVTALRNWLMQTLVGVGPAYASEVVRAWGEDVLDRIDDGATLEDLPVLDVPQGLEERIFDAIACRSVHDRAWVQLAAWEIKPKLCEKLIEAYGANRVADQVRERPYELVELHGVGFKTADTIAIAVGTRADAPERLAAGVVFALEESQSEGHVCLPPGELASTASDLLNVTYRVVEDTVQDLCSQGVLEVYDGLVYLPWVAQSESDLAQWIVAHLAREVDAIAILPPAPDGVVLDVDQRAAVRMMLSSNFCVLTGSAGTGKTTICREVIASAETAGVDVIHLASPTGRAASRLSESVGRPAMTIHRLLGVDKKDRGWHFSHNRDNPLSGKALMIDEVSMVGLDLADSLFQAVRHGMRVWIVGDPYQLPSVSAGRILHDLIECDAVPTAKLTRIYRQGDRSRVIEAAYNINCGDLPISGTDPDVGDDYFISDVESEEFAHDVLVDYVRDRIPARFGIAARDIQVICPRKKGKTGVHELNKLLRDVVNPSGREVVKGRFRVGDRVIQTRNNYDLGVYNGEIGYVGKPKSLKAKEIPVTFDSGLVVDYPVKAMGELSLAYAITIHKSQGSEWPAVIVMFYREFFMAQRDLLYTAITRGRKLVVMITDDAEGGSLGKAVSKPGGKIRHSRLTARIRALSEDERDEDKERS